LIIDTALSAVMRYTFFEGRREKAEGRRQKAEAINSD
jgi:hypothetical protein